MSRSGTYFSAMASYWGALAQDIATRYRSAWQDVEDRTYTPARILSDAVEFWARAADSWWSAIVSNASTAVPVVLFEITVGSIPTQTKAEPIPLRVPTSGTPSKTGLARIWPPPSPANTGGQEIPPDHVRVDLAPDGRELRVHLVGLDTLHLTRGHYEGLVYREGAPLAVLHVVAS
jgi:hypothetical protein